MYCVCSMHAISFHHLTKNWRSRDGKSKSLQLRAHLIRPADCRQKCSEFLLKWSQNYTQLPIISSVHHEPNKTDIAPKCCWHNTFKTSKTDYLVERCSIGAWCITPCMYMTSMTNQLSHISPLNYWFLVNECWLNELEAPHYILSDIKFPCSSPQPWERKAFTQLLCWKWSVKYTVDLLLLLLLFVYIC